MAICPACGRDPGAISHFCPHCGARLQAAAELTVLAPSSAAETRLGPSTPDSRLTPHTPSTQTPFTSRDGGRFAPGTVLVDRYRIVGMLGKGGMGEVYRADDLRLDQSVALKFLPDSVATDPSRLAQFHNEVRVARQVTHKNVCRMYDIGEVDGRPFLSMEYVDGEDLATLLRRIGRLPQDKAVEMARQLCAGLAAAHERGVLHRDLKPANVMVDGQGHVRLTDFGIAGTADQLTGSREGTPGYMAPEQLTEGRASVQSDLFSLGLVLYEMFTGRRGIEVKTFDDLLRLHERGVDLSTTATQPDLDPAIDRVIRRCLARDAANRPSSALGVSAALPGGDPLAAALAAGETPSPEMVAAAGRNEAVPAVMALSLLAAFAAGLLMVALWGNGNLLIRRLPFDRPPEVLADRAQTLLASLGYTAPPADRAWGFGLQQDVLRYIRTTRRGPDRWAWLASGRAPAVVFYYRSSPRRLDPVGVSPRPTLADPPLTVSGMASVLLDTEARLLELNVVPPQLDAGPEEAGSAGPDWAPLFAAAGLSVADFAAATPEWTPRGFADTRAAWTGALAELGDVPIRIEAASYRGTPVFFSIVGPWTRPSRMEEAPVTMMQRVAEGATAVTIIVILAAAVLMARNNLRSGRGDRDGAGRLALLVLALGLGSWLFGAPHYADASQQVSQFLLATALSLLSAGIIWVAYLALEPVVRRRWPTGIIGWTRALAGRWRDPLVGRDVLIGMTAGVALVFVLRLGLSGMAWLGLPPPTPRTVSLVSLGGVHLLLDQLLTTASDVIVMSLVVVLLFVVIRLLVRWRPVAFAGATVLFAVLISGDLVAGEMPVLEMALALGVATFVTAVAWHFGVLALASMLLVNRLTFVAPIVVDFATWYTPQTLTVVGLLAGLAVTAFVVSRGREPLLGRRLLEP